jgi:hypothetical protein
VSSISLGADIDLCPGVRRSSSKPVLLNGNGHTLRATCATDLLVQDGTGTLSLREVTLRDATTDYDQNFGDAVLASGATVVLVGSQILHNDGWTGAVRGHDVRVVDSRFEDNALAIELGGGGAVVAVRDAVAWRSSFVNNFSIGDAGGINAGVDITVDGSRFERNFSTSNAGALNAFGNVTANRSTFTTNGTGGAGLGGVVTGAVVTILSSSFDDGSAGFGDGGFVGGEKVRVRDSSFTNGRNFGHGGAIVGTDVDVRTSTFTSNTASDGGAISVTRSLTIDSSTFAGNSTNEDFGTASGGALFQSGHGTVTITNSTFTQNHAATSRGDGSAIASSSPVQLVFVSVVGNPTSSDLPQAQISGTGPWASLATFGSVFSAAGAGDNCSIPTTSRGFNYSDDASCALTQPTDHTSAPPPLLGPLADNGGPTETLLPAANSPLVDTIPPPDCPLHVDQRGAHRPHGPACDIGSVER